MLGIFNALKGFFEFIISIVGFVIRIFEDLAYVVKILADTVLRLPLYLGFLPTIVVSLFVVYVCCLCFFCKNPSAD